MPLHGAALMIFVVIATFAGCSGVNYQAAGLPSEFRTPLAKKTSGISLARFSNSGFSSSRISPGDLVQVTLSSGRGEETVEPIQSRVAQDGSIQVPLVGAVSIAGLEPFEAGQRIANLAIERNIYQQPHISLEVTEQAVNRITVMGAVDDPGVHEVPRGTSDLLSALAAAGGLTEEAGTEVEVLRNSSPSFLAQAEGRFKENTGEATDGVSLASYPGPPTPSSDNVGPAPLFGTTSPPYSGPSGPSAGPRSYRIDLAQADPNGRNNYALGDRDVVMVFPEKKRVFHVSGLVHKPNQFEIPNDQDIRLLDAIAMAGGRNSPVADKVFIIRHVEDEPEPIIIKASIAKAKRDGNENLRLAPGDLISVESTPVTTLVDTATKFLRVAVGVSGRVTAF